ncbi:hypothetical protein ACLOJK_026530 [Asimina triloba]
MLASGAKISSLLVELQTIDGLVKDRTQCAPNGYYFIPVYDKVPVVVDQNGCNANADINFQFTGFTVSGIVLGAVGGGSCSSKDGGPSNVKVELLSVDDNLVSSVFTSSSGVYSFRNIIPGPSVIHYRIASVNTVGFSGTGKYKLRASHPDLNVEVRGSPEVELGFGNGIVDDIFFVPGYDIHGFVVAQGNPILGVHMYLYSDDVLEVACPQGTGASPRERDALCHAVSDADGKFTLSCVKYLSRITYLALQQTTGDVLNGEWKMVHRTVRVPGGINDHFSAKDCGIIIENSMDDSPAKERVLSFLLDSDYLGLPKNMDGIYLSFDNYYSDVAFSLFTSTILIKAFLYTGIYELWPYYKGENTIFDVSPPSMIVSVEHHHVTISRKFQVTGFSVGGRVVDGNGVGVEGVKIIVDGQIRSVTDWQGYYKLDQVTSKHYTILAEKDHYKFNSLENFLVLPNMASVPDINAAYYDICGVVRSISADYMAKVILCI